VILDVRKDAAGFGLVELLIAMTVLSVAILAMVATLSSGATAIDRSSRVTRAGALADGEMEAFRSLPWGTISLDSSKTLLATPSPALCSTSCAIDVTASAPAATASCPTVTSTTWTTPLYDTHCPSRTVLFTDGRTYRVDNYIRWICPSAGDPSTASCTGASPAARRLKLVTIIVRAGDDLTKVLYRESSTFDQSTGY
jgi:prepilin-type N-terminal cleavage/methylation domain-containing protein